MSTDIWFEKSNIFIGAFFFIKRFVKTAKFTLAQREMSNPGLVNQLV